MLKAWFKKIKTVVKKNSGFNIILNSVLIVNILILTNIFIYGWHSVDLDSNTSHSIPLLLRCCVYRHKCFLR